MSRDILNSIINDFDPEKFARFFREKNRSAFAPRKEELFHYDDEDFKNGLKLGEIAFTDAKLFVCVFQVSNSLSERSGKKAQYEKAKKILKAHREYNAGIFVFYDANGNFRFSLIYDIPHGNKRDWSNFRRFTYFVSKEFTNKTFLKQIGESDFSSLEKIKDAFSVEKVTKEFFSELSHWYFWALKYVVFPEDAEKEKNGKNITVIRLITRLVFIWFMKHKGLIKKHLFDENEIKKYLKDLSPKESTYYKAILQNLFFATLNTPIKERRFRFKISGWKNSSYMDHRIYRYEDYFKNQEDMLGIFKNIPFLNGGLFECLDKGKNVETNDTSEEIRIDGFSDRKDNLLYIPNFLFFSNEQVVNLNSNYGTKNKRYTAKGIINILQSYNFTIDENTPVDEEIALDPELLGKVFENLLASYNPETATTARRATGSYYTPREIVNYMVEQSLREYFKTKLSDIPKLDKKLNQLFSYADEINPFNEEETDILIQAINNLKVIDPAVGSGAFPMGILQKLVLVLSKLDPHNGKWEQQQIDGIEKNVLDVASKRDSIQKIEQNFEQNELDYGRKLYLIKKSIYGVDIQPIAIQIAKLRFFISLLVDEKVDKNNPDNNFGIEPLPNLETKFVSANSLIGLETVKRKEQLTLIDSRIDTLEKELKENRDKYFDASYIKQKEKLRKKDKEIRQKLTVLLKENNFSTKNTKRITNWDPYNSNISADWFDPEWMFGIKDGFDIAIANPPYGILNKKQNKAESTVVSDEELEFYKSSKYYEPAVGGMINIFRLFILRSIYLLAKDGIFSEIFPLAFTGDLSISGLRKYILDHNEILFIEAFPERDNPNKRVFEAAKMSVCILNLRKRKSNKQFFIRVNTDKFIDANAKKNYLTKETINTLDKENCTFPLTTLAETNLLLRIFSNSIRFSEIGNCGEGEVHMTFYKKSFTDNPQDIRLLKGAIIDRYQLRKKMSQGKIVYIDEKIMFSLKKNLPRDFKIKERIVSQGITGVNESSRLKMMIVKDAYCANS